MSRIRIIIKFWTELVECLAHLSHSLLAAASDDASNPFYKCSTYPNMIWNLGFEIQGLLL